MSGENDKSVNTVSNASPNTVSNLITLYGIHLPEQYSVQHPNSPATRRRANSEPVISTSMKQNMVLAFGIKFPSIDSEEAFELTNVEKK